VLIGGGDQGALLAIDLTDAQWARLNLVVQQLGEPNRPTNRRWATW